MKKLLVVLVLVLFAGITQAQWLTNGTNVYYNGGNVGIGTSTPAQLLHLYGATKANIYVESGFSGSTLQTLGSFQAKASNGEYFSMAFRHNAGGYQDMLQTCNINGFGVAEFMYFRFDTRKWEMHAGVANAEFLNTGTILFNNGGAVGIGMGSTAIPAGTKLAIAGKVSCKEIEVTLTGLPDYVFSSDYKLRSLYDVENFINTNKHLPEVPSAKEVTEKGMNLGDMNSTLLQKVEELTLYMIQLQKENDALKARVSNLEK
jgi:hypothetical protein